MEFNEKVRLVADGLKPDGKFNDFEIMQLCRQLREAKSGLRIAEAKLKEYEQSLKLSGKVNAKLMRELLEMQDKVAAMESQKPAGKVVKWLDSNTAICSGEGFAAAAIDADLYFKPVPADKPAAAADEKTNSRGEPEAIYLQLHDQNSFSETEVADFRADCVTWCWHKINQNDVRYIREDLAAPSNSQQYCPIPWIPVLRNRADGVDGHYAIGRFNPSGYWEFWNLISNKWASASDKVLSLDGANDLLSQLVIPTSAVHSDRCPSHESEEQ